MATLCQFSKLPLYCKCIICLLDGVLAILVVFSSSVYSKQKMNQILKSPSNKKIYARSLQSYMYANIMEGPVHE